MSGGSLLYVSGQEPAQVGGAEQSKLLALPFLPLLTSLCSTPYRCCSRLTAPCRTR